MSQETPWTEEEILELLPLYRLGALEPEEVVIMEKHLASNPHLLAHLVETDHALVALAESAPYAALPVNAKEQLLAAVRSESQPAGAVPRPLVAPRLKTRKTWWAEWWQGRGVWSFAAAATFAALVLLIFYTANLSTRLNDTEQQVARLTQENNELAEEKADLAAANQTLTLQIQLLQNDFNTNRELLASAQSDPSLLQAVVNASNTIVLHNHTDGNLPRGVFYQTGHTGQLVVHGLAPLPTNQTYQFWAVTQDGTQIPTALVTVQDANAATWTTVILPDSLNVDEVIAIGISIEPARGSQTPTSPMLLDAEF